MAVASSLLSRTNWSKTASSFAICINLSLKSKGEEYARSIYLKDLREIDSDRETLILKQGRALL
jgi:hypothetical protein